MNLIDNYFLATQTFQTEVAIEAGVNAALLFESFSKEWQRHIDMNEHFYHDLYWAYGNMQSLQKLFPFMDKDDINEAVRSLVREKYVIFGTFKIDDFEDFSWFSYTPKGAEFAELRNI